jgi:hypothetical protein
VGLRIVALTLRAAAAAVDQDPPPVQQQEHGPSIECGPVGATSQVLDAVPAGEENVNISVSCVEDILMTGGGSRGTTEDEAEEAVADDDEAMENRTVLLGAIQNFSKHWKVTPPIFFMLGQLFFLLALYIFYK